MNALGLGLDSQTDDVPGGGAVDFNPGDALLLDDGVSFLLLGGGTDKLLLTPQ